MHGIREYKYEVSKSSEFRQFDASNTEKSKGYSKNKLPLGTIIMVIWAWLNNRKAGDWRRHRAHYDRTVMGLPSRQQIVIP